MKFLRAIKSMPQAECREAGKLLLRGDERTFDKYLEVNRLSRRALLTRAAFTIGIAGSTFLRPSPLWGKSQPTAPPRTFGMSEAEVLSVKDFGADSTGVEDCTSKFQSAVNHGNVVFPPGTYKMSWSAMRADVRIPANRKIIIEKGATVTMTGGRFTAENVENVEWQIDGWVKSVAMRTADSKLLWTASVGERGFFEFAEDYVASSAASGFWVHGTGKVSGDWTGTPNADDYANQTNRKGIACWNAANVLVEGLEVFGFDGEAVYASFFDAASSNIVFQNLSVHDTRHNALNFNAAHGTRCHIRHNRVSNAFAIEASTGHITDNIIDGMVYCGIHTGQGAGSGPVEISRNTISNTSQLHGIAANYASGSPVTGVIINDNVISWSGQYGIYTDYANDLHVLTNRISGSGTDVGAYDIGINHCLRGRVAGNTFRSPGARAQAGNIAVDGNSFNVSVDPDSNVYIPTTGTAPPLRLR